MLDLTPDRVVGKEMNGRSVTIQLGYTISIQLHDEPDDVDGDMPAWFIDSDNAPVLQFLSSTPRRDQDDRTPSVKYHCRYSGATIGKTVIELSLRLAADSRVIKRYSLTVNVVGKLSPLLQERPTRPPGA